MFVIGIAGGTGSGKTTLVEKVVASFSDQDVEVIYQDNYYKDHAELSLAEREVLNYDHPDSIDFPLLVRHIEALKRGESIEQPIYDFCHHARSGKYVNTSPKKVLIIEGILVLSNSLLRELFDLKIYVEADADERLIRRMKRDISDRGRTMEQVMYQYQTNLKKMHERFIEPSRQYADLIVPNMQAENESAIEVLKAVLHQYIASV